MHVCKDCGSPVQVTRTSADNDPRLTIPRWRVVCDTCPAERGVNVIEAPTVNGIERV